jgi:hypothetical protein
LTSSSSGGSTSEAPWYGHKEIATICGRFVCDTFGSPDLLLSDPNRHGPNPCIAHFVAYALSRTRLHQSVTFCALHLLQRLKDRFPAAKGSSGHRLFICAFMIASKVVCDDTYSNKSCCVVGQSLFALKEMNQMEREMCGYLDWQLRKGAYKLLYSTCLSYGCISTQLRRKTGFSAPRWSGENGQTRTPHPTIIHPLQADLGSSLLSFFLLSLSSSISHPYSGAQIFWPSPLACIYAGLRADDRLVSPSAPFSSARCLTDVRSYRSGIPVQSSSPGFCSRFHYSPWIFCQTHHCAARSRGSPGSSISSYIFPPFPSSSSSSAAVSSLYLPSSSFLAFFLCFPYSLS